MRSILHMAASGLFFILVVLHITALQRDLPLLRVQNNVFPFIRNRELFSVNTVVEIIAGALCFLYRGRNMADFCILSFIGLMLWYRLAFYFTSGTETEGCGCMGFLSKLLHLTPAQETKASFAVLGILALCGLPASIKGVRLLYSRTSVASKTCQVLIAILFSSIYASDAQSVQVKGNYSFHHCNAETGKPFTEEVNGLKQWGDFSFTAVITPTARKICVTNENRTVWTEILYDGTNTFTFVPYTPPFVSESEAQSNEVLVTVSKSPYYLPSVSDWACAYIPWLAYGLNPKLVSSNKAGLVEIPLPWENSRIKPLAHGWSWRLSSSTDGRFIDKCKVIRDSRLDRDHSEEFLRMDINYPENLKIKNAYIDSLEYRKSIRDGFVDFDYRVNKWFATNDFSVPVACQLDEFMYGYKFPAVKSKLSAEIVTTDVSESLSPPSDIQRKVEDYRYKQIQHSRIYKYAAYSLAPGEAWKGPEDASILNEVAEYLKHGPKYNYYDYNGKLISLWVLGAILLFTPLVFIWFKVINNKKQVKKL
jgi:hypothetical protein